MSSGKKFLSVVADGDVEKAKAMLDKAEQVSSLLGAVDADGRSCLHLAAHFLRFPMIQFLLERGANVNAVNGKTWETVLHVATTEEIFHALLTQHDIKICAFPTSEKRDYPLHSFCQKFPLDTKLCIDKLLAKGANINAVNIHGETALHYAAGHAEPQLIQRLLDRGASLNAQNDQGETALHVASRAGNLAAVDLMLQYGANPTIKGASGTCIDVAASNVKPLYDLMFNRRSSTSSTGSTSLGQSQSDQMPPGFNREPRMSLTERRQDAPLQWEVAREEVELFDEIGRGGFGYVKRGKWKGIEVAAKFMHMDKALKNPDIFELFLQEISLMSKLHHPNILLLLGACVEGDGPIFFLTELMRRGNLRDVLLREPHMKWNLKLSIALEVCRALIFLHTRNPPVLHHDLKSANVFLDEDYHAKVADFGMSKIKSDEQRMAGSLQWSPPEVLSGESYTEKSEVYAFGVVAWELLTHKIPYDGMQELNVIASIVEGEKLPIPETTPAPFKALLDRCWNTDPDQRPAFNEIFELLRQMQDELRSVAETPSSREREAHDDTVPKHAKASQTTPILAKAGPSISGSGNPHSRSTPVPVTQPTPEAPKKPLVTSHSETEAEKKLREKHEKKEKEKHDKEEKEREKREKKEKERKEREERLEHERKEKEEKKKRHKSDERKEKKEKEHKMSRAERQQMFYTVQ